MKPTLELRADLVLLLLGSILGIQLAHQILLLVLMLVLMRPTLEIWE
jgi:hypothetical protein